MPKKPEMHILLPGLLFFVTGALLFSLLTFRDYRREEIFFTSSRHDTVRAILYKPLASPGPWPAVISLHSIFQTESLLAPMTREFVRHGYAVMIVDYEGRSRSRKTCKNFGTYCGEARDAITVLSQRKDIEGISLLGHSVGANIAVEAAGRDRRILSVVALGFPAEGSCRQQPNLLYAVGLLDELHPVSQMRSALSRAAGVPEAREGILYGSFSDYSACELFVAPLSDHYMEIFDPLFYRRALAWMDLSRGKAVSPSAIIEPLPTAGCGLMLAGMALTGLWIFRRILHIPARPCHSAGLWPAILVLSCLSGLSWWSTIIPWSRGIVLKDCIAVILLSFMAARALERRGGNLSPSTVRRWALHASVIAAALFGGIILNRISFLLEKPVYALSIPLIALMSIPTGFFVLIDRTASLLFFCINGVPLMIFPFLAELLRPGWLVVLAADFAAAAVEFIRKTRISLNVKSSPAHCAVLALCIMGAFLAWRQILGEGYDFDRKSVTALVLLLLNLVIVPFLITFALFRSRLFKVLEEKLR